MSEQLNSKIKKDIQQIIGGKKAELAIAILSKVEEKKSPSHSEIKALASKIYSEEDKS